VHSIRPAIFRVILAFAALTLPACAATINVPAGQPTIQAGINAANTGDTVLVAPGTYYENINFNGKAITVTSSAGAASTIIDGGKLAPVVTLGTSDPSISGSQSTLTGFTAQNGVPAAGATDTGGGIVVVGHANLQNDTVTANASCGIDITAGVYATINENHIYGNTQNPTGTACRASGAGIYISGPGIVLIDSSTIETNQGSGIYMDTAAGSATFADDIIRNNSGYGVYAALYSLNFDQNLIYSNSGPGLYLNIASIGFISVGANTFYGNDTANTNNSAPPYASQVIVNNYNSSFIFVDNLIVGTSSTYPAVGCPTYIAGTYPLVWDHNDIYDTQTVNAANPPCDTQIGSFGNIAGDPLFKNASTGDFHLTTGSPAIDAGNGSDSSTGAVDLDGNVRAQDATGKGYPIGDIGVYEFPGTQDAQTTGIYLNQTYQYLNIVVDAGSTASIGGLLENSSTGTLFAGQVTLFEDGIQQSVSTSSSSGTIAFTTDPLTAGLHSFVVTYPGQSTNAPTVSEVLYIPVIGSSGTSTTTTLTSSLNPANLGQSVTFTANITSNNGTPTGTVTFTDGATTLSTQNLVAGSAVLTTSSLTVGTHTITATYNPSGNFAASSNFVSQIINGIPTTTTLTATVYDPYAGQPTTLTAHTFETASTTTYPGGTITLMDGSATLASGLVLDANGNALYTTSSLAVGTHHITAIYSGNSTHSPGTSLTITMVVYAASDSLTLTSALNPAGAYQTFGLTAQFGTALPIPIVNYPIGSVITFYANGSPIGSAVLGSTGAATLNTALQAGSYSLTASFNATASFVAAVSNPVAESVTAVATTVALAATPNPGVQNNPVALTATVSALVGSGLPAGTVTFYDGAVPLGTAALDAASHATLSIASLAPGTHSLTATYTVTTNFLGSASAPVSLYIAPQDYLLTTPPTFTLQTEHHGSFSVTLTSIGSFTDNIAFACGNLPPVAICTFSNDPAALSANATITPSVHIETDAVTDFKSELERTGITLAVLLPFTLFVLRRRKLTTQLLAILLAITALSLTACSGKYPASTPPGTYTITISAAGINTHVVHSATVTFVVTP